MGSEKRRRRKRRIIMDHTGRTNSVRIAVPHETLWFIILSTDRTAKVKVPLRSLFPAAIADRETRKITE